VTRYYPIKNSKSNARVARYGAGTPSFRALAERNRQTTSTFQIEGHFEDEHSETYWRLSSIRMLKGRRGLGGSYVRRNVGLSIDNKGSSEEFDIERKIEKIEDKLSFVKKTQITVAIFCLVIIILFWS